MNIKDIAAGDTLVNVDKNGAGYYRVLKVNRVTVDVVGENGNKVRAYPNIFDRKVEYPVAALPAERKIVTSHVYPPIPTRGNDWCAYYDGEEENGGYGWGATEAEAIQDFKDNHEDDEG